MAGTKLKDGDGLLWGPFAPTAQRQISHGAVDPRFPACTATHGALSRGDGWLVEYFRGHSIKLMDRHVPGEQAKSTLGRNRQQGGSHAVTHRETEKYAHVTSSSRAAWSAISGETRLYGAETQSCDI